MDTKRSLYAPCAAWCALALVSAASLQGEPTMIKLGTATGGVAVYYNDATENPSNISYYRAQYANSMTDVNGAQFSFSTEDIDPNYPGISPAAIFGTHDNFGFDMLVEWGTNTGVVPELHGVDRTPPPTYDLNPTDMGEMMWGVSDYKSGGPTNPSAVMVNTLFRGMAGTVLDFDLQEITGGWQMSLTGTLRSDNLVHWYGEGTSDTVWDAAYGIANWLYFESALTYLVADDTTPGMDFYAGTIDLYVVPEPATLTLLVLGGALVASRRKHRS
jgi:hypothetical protein